MTSRGSTAGQPAANCSPRNLALPERDNLRSSSGGWHLRQTRHAGLAFLNSTEKRGTRWGSVSLSEVRWGLKGTQGD